VEITVQKALEKFPVHNTGIISYKGSQFISKDIAVYLKFAGVQHIKT